MKTIEEELREALYALNRSLSQADEAAQGLTDTDNPWVQKAAEVRYCRNIVWEAGEKWYGWTD